MNSKEAMTNPERGARPALPEFESSLAVVLVNDGSFRPPAVPLRELPQRVQFCPSQLCSSRS